MEILRKKIRDLYIDFKIIKGYESERDKYFAYGDMRECVNDVFKSLNEVYLEEVIDAEIESYDDEGSMILNGIYECRADKIDNILITVPTKHSILTDEKYDAKVYMILKLMCNKRDVVSKQKLYKNKDSILKIYNIDEDKFIKGFNDLIKLGLIKDCGEKFELKLDGICFTYINRDICKELAKENIRKIKVYQFLYEHLIFEDEYKTLNYAFINSATGYKDEKSLKFVIDKLVDMDLVNRKKIIENSRIYYKYSIPRTY